MEISIITINFNNLAGLKKTVQSVLDQTYSQIDYIVIDGGSDDGSSQYINDLGNHFSYWVSEKDEGIYNAMNKGIKKASGEYLLFLNSGDWLFNKTVIEDLVSFKPSKPFVYGDLIMYYDAKNTQLSNNEGKSKFTLGDLLFGNLNHQSTFIKKSIFDQYGLYNEHLKIVSDWELFLKAIGLNGEEVEYFPLSISYFDMDGICTNNKKLRNEERRIVMEEIVPSYILRDYDSFLGVRNKATAFDLIKNNRFLWLLIRVYNKLFKVY